MKVKSVYQQPVPKREAGYDLFEIELAVQDLDNYQEATVKGNEAALYEALKICLDQPLYTFESEFLNGDANLRVVL